MTLTKRDIARAIHNADATISVTEAVGIIDVLLRQLKRRLTLSEKVMITNFGTFEISTRAARRGINPSTGERMIIPAHRAVTFQPAPALQDEVND